MNFTPRVTSTLRSLQLWLRWCASKIQLERTPEIQQKLKEAQAALERNAAQNSGKLVYTFDWDLRPMSGAP